MNKRMNASLMRAFAWSGIVMVVAMVIAMVPLMHFIPPPSPTLSAQEVARIFIDNKTGIRLGAAIMSIFWCFWISWGVVICLFVRKMEGSDEWPILTYSMLTLIGGGLFFFMVVPMTWALLAFRPEALDPQLIQMVNDWVWFDFLLPWSPFSLLLVVFALAIFGDGNSPRIFPRWFGFFSLWCALLLAPASVIMFFKTGPFAYDGLLAFWFPPGAFFTWQVILTFLMLKAINVEERRLGAAAGRI